MSSKSGKHSKLAGLKKDSGFRVPENYFEQLNEKIGARITKSESVAGKRGHIRLWVSIAAAAIFIGFVLLTFRMLNSNSAFEKLSQDEIAGMLEAEIYNLDGFAFEEAIMENEFYSPEAISKEYNDEVIQYLLDEGVDLEAIVNEL